MNCPPAAAAAAAKAAAERGASAIDPLMMMAMQPEEPRAMARQAKISVKMLKRIIEREEVTEPRGGEQLLLLLSRRAKHP